MKKTACQLGVFVIVFVMAVGFGASKSWAEDINLSYNAVWPMEFPGAKAQKEWIDRVESRSGGRVKIKFYPGGKLYGYTASERAVASGAVDITQFGIQQLQVVMSRHIFRVDCQRFRVESLCKNAGRCRQPSHL